MMTIICIIVYIVSAILVAEYHRETKEEKDVFVLFLILCPLFNTILVMLGIIGSLVFCIVWFLEHFPLTKMLLRWVNNGKETEKFT